MSVGSINGSSVALATSPAQTNVQETLEQRAQKGDPIAIAELKNENPQPQAAQQTGGAPEPGKGGAVDEYI